jgi:FlaA1/EpsC-like NDP-sugar epimerase
VVRHALEASRADSVFHAAAYKQVPLLETQLREAIRNNVLATETVAAESHRAGVSSLVLISTDKAVDPVNVLGATKRLAEKVCQAQALEGSATRSVTVRFGNVLDSAGSVVPLFREQIRRGGPVTVTDPEVTRYFMTIPEACLLILQAAAMGSPHAIYTLDMGEPVAIKLLAEQMIRLAGKQPDRDIAIVYTGLRRGEKLHETLFHADERYRPTSHPKILQAEARAILLDRVLAIGARMRAAVARYDNEELALLLREAVPEFDPHDSEAAAGRDATGAILPFPARAGRKP